MEVSKISPNQDRKTTTFILILATQASDFYHCFYNDLKEKGRRVIHRISNSFATPIQKVDYRLHASGRCREENGHGTPIEYRFFGLECVDSGKETGDST